MSFAVHFTVMTNKIRPRAAGADYTVRACCSSETAPPASPGSPGRSAGVRPEFGAGVTLTLLAILSFCGRAYLVQPAREGRLAE